MTAAAIYARVSSARQAKDQTIGSQLSAPRGHAASGTLPITARGAETTGTRVDQQAPPDHRDPEGCTDKSSRLMSQSV
jgi:hypothetical protein